MGRYSVVDVKIGDIYHTWKVVEKEEGKYNYNYKCECINCGATKSISKYNLLRNSYAICHTCGVKSVLESNIDEILRYWNKDLNDSFLMEEILSNPTKTYWFTCSKGHNFRKTLRDFAPDQCPTCKKLEEKRMFRGGQPIEKLNGGSFFDCYPHVIEFWNFRKNKDNPKEVFPRTNKKKYWFTCSEGHEFQRTPFEIARGIWCPYCNINHSESKLATMCKQIFKSMYYDVKVENEFPIKTTVNGKETTLYPDIIIEDIKLAIEIHGSQHREYSKTFHKSEAEFLKAIDRDKAKKKWLIEHGYTYKVIEATSDFEKDVDKLERFVLELIHEL